MRIDFKSVHCFTGKLFVLLINEAVSLSIQGLKKEWSYFGLHSIGSENQNDHAPLHRRQGDFSSAESHRYFKPEKLIKTVTANDRTSPHEPDNDSNEALSIPSKNVIAENESTEAKDEIEKVSNAEKSAFEDNGIVIDDPDPGFTGAPDVISGTGYKKYNEEKVSHTQGNLATSWPLGIIPYYFDMVSYDHILARRVREVMDSLESASCVQFKPLVVKPEEEQNWIHITNPDLQRECMHRGMHRGTGEIRMVLGLDCLKHRDILHSLLHAMGFTDEVSHPHRDQFIRVMWNNIQPRYQHLFSIASSSPMPVEYDPMSIMHFHDRAFTKNGHATIVPLMPGLQIQPSDKLSQLDKAKLRLAFGHECNRRTVDNLLDTCKAVLHEERKSNSNVSLMAAPKMKLKVRQLGNSSAITDPEDDPETNLSNEKTEEDKTATDPKPDSSNENTKEDDTVKDPKHDSSNESPKVVKRLIDLELESFEQTKESSAGTSRTRRTWGPTLWSYSWSTTPPYDPKKMTWVQFKRWKIVN